MEGVLAPLNVSLPKNHGNYLFSGESISCPFINRYELYGYQIMCSKQPTENDLILEHLLQMYDTNVISYDKYTTLCNLVKCEDVVVINALNSDMQGNPKPFIGTLSIWRWVLELIKSNFLNQNTDFCYLDHLSPFSEYDLILDEELCSVLFVVSWFHSQW